MKRELISLLVLALAASNVYAEGNKDASAAMAGKWNNSSTHQNFSINKRGVVGLSAAECGEIYQQEFAMKNTTEWLSNAERMAKDKSIPMSQYNALTKEIDRTKVYPQLSSSCGEGGDQFILVNPNAMISMSCGEGNCLVVRYVRVR